MKGYVDTANSAVVSYVNTLNSAMASNVDGANTSIQILSANIGSYYTYANANSYTNTNVAAYLTTASITTTGTITATALGGTVNTASQPNITTLAGLTSFGTAGITTIVQGNLAIPTRLLSTDTKSNVGTLTVGGNINYGPDHGLVASFVANIPNYAYIAVQNLNTGGNASASFTSYNDVGNYLELGVSSSNFNAISSGYINNSLNQPNASYAYSYGGEMVVGTWGDNGLHFITNGGARAGDSMLIAGNGNVYISGNLTVSGNVTQVYTTTNFLTTTANVTQTSYINGNAQVNNGNITATNNLVMATTTAIFVPYGRSNAAVDISRISLAHALIA
jgi:hypothetical protein